MTPEEFLEQMKLVLSNCEGGTESLNTNPTQNIIAKPTKNYISAQDVLSIFNINKDIYNNLLVRIKVFNGQ
jgi:hypothetical protein